MAQVIEGAEKWQLSNRPDLRADGHVDRTDEAIAAAVMYTATRALTFLVAIVVMLSIDWGLTLIALLPVPPVTIASRYFGRAIHERFERIQSQLSDLSAVTQEALAGVRVVRAYRQEARELERFRDANLEYVQRNRALIRMQGLSLLNEMRSTVGRGQLPARAIADAMMIGLAGLLLLLPGYFSDLIGILLLIPPVRSAIYAYLKSRVTVVTTAGGTGPGFTQHRVDDGTIDLDSDEWRPR